MDASRTTARSGPGHAQRTGAASDALLLRHQLRVPPRCGQPADAARGLRPEDVARRRRIVVFEKLEGAADQGVSRAAEALRLVLAAERYADLSLTAGPVFAGQHSQPNHPRLPIHYEVQGSLCHSA